MQVTDRATVTKWRDMDINQAIIWAHLRLDRIEQVLGLDNRHPDLEEIAQKLQEEATEKDTYTPDGSPSIFPQCVTKLLVVVKAGFRHLFNRVSRPDQGKGQNNTSNIGG